MSADAYYRAEEARWAYLNSRYPTDLEMACAITRWSDAGIPAGDTFRLLVLPKDSKRLQGWADGEVIAVRRPVSWLLLVHEFAHHMQWRTCFKGRCWHGPFHARLVDDLCKDVIRAGFV